jgi:mRNA interferase MazF
MAGPEPTIHVFFNSHHRSGMPGGADRFGQSAQGRPLWPEMTKTSERFDAFDVVVVPFPYADRLAEKRRPALVISNRRLAPLGLIWVAMITSADNAPWSCDVTIANLGRAGLPAPSVVRTAKIACIEPARIERRAGRLERATAKAVAQKLKGFWGSA